MSTIREVADMAGVSVATVSRTLQQPDRVSPKTRVRVQEAIDHLGYKPNLMAVKFRSGKTQVLVALVPTVANVFFARVIKGMQEAAASQGYSLLLMNTMGDDGIERNCAKLVDTSQADGVIQLRAFNPFAPDQFQSEALLPMVNACEIVDGARFPTVTLDNRAAAKAMTQHLISLGHRRIAMVKGPQSSPLTRDRLAGYEDALKAAGLSIDDSLLCAGDFTLSSGYRAATTLLDLPKRPTAIFCENDEMAMGAMRKVREAGLSIPEDISIAGFDNIAFSAYAEPPLTTIAQPAEEFGETAVNVLIDVLNGKTKHALKVILPFELITRQSTGPAPDSANP